MTSPRFENVWNILHEYDFEMNNDVSNDLLCSICKKLMKKATVGICGCRYCFECIRNYLNEEERFCPGRLTHCNDEIMDMNENVLLDQVLNFRIMKTTVKCPLGSCEYRSELRNMEDHLKTCKSRPVNCPYFNFGCDKDKLEGDKMKDHLEIDNYRHTKLLIEYVDNFKHDIKLLKKEIVELKDENNHQKNEMTIVKLDSDRKQVEIDELQENVKMNSELVEILNENYTVLKNENKSMKEDISNLKETHRQNQVTIVELQRKSNINDDEVKLLNEEMVPLKNENRSMRDEINNLKGKDRLNQMAILALQTESDMRSVQVERLEEKCDELKRFLDEKHLQSIESIERMHQINVDLIEKSDWNGQAIEIIEKKTENMDQNIYKMKMDLMIQNYGEFMWIIEGISDKVKQAKDGIVTQIFSDAFFSHKNGYKMCLELDPGGFEFGKGSHLSVYFCVMSGPFDDILSWPFKGDVTFSLMNQQFGFEHTSKILKYSHSSGRKKPTKECNDGIGYQQFIKLDQLLSNVELIKGDKIIIKCSVQSTQK